MVSLEKSILIMKWSEVKWKPLSRVWLFATPWTVQNSPDQNTVQNPPGQNTAQNSPGQNTVQNSPGQNTGVGSLSLLQGIFWKPGIEPRSPALQADSLPAEPQRKPKDDI